MQRYKLNLAYLDIYGSSYFDILNIITDSENLLNGRISAKYNVAEGTADKLMLVRPSGLEITLANLKTGELYYNQVDLSVREYTELFILPLFEQNLIIKELI